VWGYGTTDPLEEVLRRDYFETARGLLRPGELIYVSTAPMARPGEPPCGDVRLALVMVRADERGAAVVRLVQDFGRSGAPAGTVTLSAAPAAAPVRRGRGRPPGSRTKKPARSRAIAARSELPPGSGGLGNFRRSHATDASAQRPLPTTGSGAGPRPGAPNPGRALPLRKFRKFRAFSRAGANFR
jgi:hypothetical protein